MFQYKMNRVEYPSAEAKAKVESTIPDHVYIDGNLYNNSYLSPTGPVQYIPAIISQSRDSPIIFDPSYYNLTIARFSISSDDVPRVHQPLLTAASGPTATTFWVGLSYNNVYYDQPVILPTVTTALQQQAKICYNINAFLDLINTAYGAAQTAAVIGGAPTGVGQVAMTYNDVTMLYTLNVPTYYGTGTIGVTAGNGIGVHMSFLLYQKFQSYNIIQNSPLLYNNHDVTFVREITGNNLITNLTFNGGVTGTYMGLAQEVAWASSIMDAHRLIITTSSLPIYSEYISNINYQQLGGGNGNQTLATVTDFFIGHDAELASRGNKFIYTPALYRLVSLRGSTPLTQWDIRIYIGYTDGRIIPLYIPPGGELSIKLLFLKKGLTN